MWVDVVIWYEGAVITEDREETNKKNVQAA